MKGFAENKMRVPVPPEFVREPIVIYNTNTTTVYISTDGFETYSSMVLSGYGSLSTLMNGVLFIVSSTKYYYSFDGGNTWGFYINTNASLTEPSASIGGRYMILPGNTGTAVYHKFTSDYGVSWVNLPLSIYHSGYGGASSWLSPDGSKGLVYNRSSGLGYTSNFGTNWGLHLRNTGNFSDPLGLGAFSYNGTGWSSLSYGFSNYTYFLFNYSGAVDSYSAPIPVTSSSMTTLSSIHMEPDNTIYYSLYDGYYKLNPGSITPIKISTTILPLSILKRNGNTVIDNYNTNSIYVNNVLLNNIFRASKGEHQIYYDGFRIYVISNTNKLMVSDNLGINWTDKTNNMIINNTSFFSHYRT